MEKEETNGKMNERDACQTGDPSRKDKGKLRKCKAASMLLAPSNWPKVMVSRDDRICERAELLTEVSPSSSGQRANGREGEQEEEEENEEGDRRVEHLCCNEKGRDRCSAFKIIENVRFSYHFFT